MKRTKFKSRDNSIPAVFIILVIMAGIILGLMWSENIRAESAVFPACTQTSLDKYIFKNGCVIR